MTATTSIRAEAKARLVLLLGNDPALADVQLRHSPPREGIEGRSVFLGDSRGAASINGLKSGRKVRRDEWVQDVWLRAAAQGDASTEQSDADVLEMFAALEDLLADNPTLSLDGNGLPGLIHGILRDYDGPSPEIDETGVASTIRAEVSFLARLT